MSSRSRNGSSSGSSGTTAVPPAGSEATTSAFASATRSTVPSSSRCTGPMLVITPTSGRAIAHSSAIWPSPRMPISQTTTSVSGSIRVSVSGRPISLLCPSSAATVRACGRQSAARMSFVEVLPVEPVMPTTRAELRARTAPPSAASAANASSGTSVAAAPRAKACRQKSAPPPTRDEEVALLDAPRVDLHAGHLVRPGRGVEPAGTERGDLFERERDHGVAAPSLLRASRATSRSSKGTVRSRNCCPCSWPLPAISTTSSDRRGLDRAGDRLAPVRDDLELAFRARRRSRR